MNIFTATLLLHNLPSATHPSLLSAKTFFIAARNATVLFDEDNKATVAARNPRDGVREIREIIVIY